MMHTWRGTGRARAVSVAALAVAAASVVPAAASGGDSSPVSSAAYGVAVTANSGAGAHAGLAPTPQVSSPADGGTANGDVAGAAPASGRVLRAEALQVRASSDADQATDAALSRVGEVTVPHALAIRAVTASCAAGDNGLAGSTDILGVNAGGHELALPTHPHPNTVVTVPHVGSITLNEQGSETSDGIRTLTVDAIHVHLSTAATTVSDVVVGQVSCQALAAQVANIDPDHGPTTGGTTVTITGSGLTGATGVTFGDTPGTNLNPVDDSTLTVDTPAHDAGPVTVTVDTPGGTVTAPGPFTFVAGSGGGDNGDNGGNGPSISDLSPASGPTDGGTVVEISGEDLSGTTGVTFDGDPGTDLNVIDDHTVDVTTPAHDAGSVPVSLAASDGTADSPVPFQYTDSGSGGQRSVAASGGRAPGSGAPGSGSPAGASAASSGALPFSGMPVAPYLAAALLALMLGAHLLRIGRRVLHH